MKFPGGDRLRQIRRALFPTDAELEADHQARLAALSAKFEAEALAERDAREAAANELRLACAERLKPYIGSLVIVSNFKGVVLEENAARIRDAVLTPAHFGADRRIGVSAVLSYGRGNHGQLIETAGALRDAFEGSMGKRAFLSRPQYESSDLWLLSLAQTAEDTASQANVPPTELGCVAVVSALEMNRQANIPEVPAPGTAFKLTHISQGAHFGWETLSAPAPTPGA